MQWLAGVGDGGRRERRQVEYVARLVVRGPRVQVVDNQLAGGVFRQAVAAALHQSADSPRCGRPSDPGTQDETTAPFITSPFTSAQNAIHSEANPRAEYVCIQNEIATPELLSTLVLFYHSDFPRFPQSKKQLPTAWPTLGSRTTEDQFLHQCADEQLPVRSQPGTH